MLFILQELSAPKERTNDFSINHTCCFVKYLYIVFKDRMAQMCIYFKNISINQIFAVLSLVSSNKKKCQRDMEAKYLGKTL